ncbi:MAG TPA: TonB-dependent receptor [Deltaproteobacteria bacterium]|nr:TonB-dependent receptor [Deltaproteobacteria bacterium]
MFTRKMIATSMLVAMAFLAGASGCGKKPSEVTTTTPTDTGKTGTSGTGTAVPAAGGTGTIKGKVSFTGTAPDMPELNREADPFCAKTPMKDQEIVVNSNGTLKNVALVVQGATAAAPAEAVTSEIDQNNCMYAPRVITAAFGQTVKIVNSDPILHNVHTYADSKTLFNRAQPKGSPAIDKTFSKDDGSVVKFKCDVHPWMTGWLVLGDNALTAVTGDNGEFEIKNVPAGTYKIQAWQEKYGPKTMDVTVTADGSAEVNFSYDGSEKAAYDYKEIHLTLAR